MLSLGSLSAVRRFAFFGAAVVLGAAVAQAQTATFSSSSHNAVLHNAALSGESLYSSSNDFAVPDLSSADPAVPASPAAGHGGQYDNRSGPSGRQWTFEAGGGFNAPVGNDRPYITWGGNLTIGGGLRFKPWFSLLGEYQFIDDKLPGAFIAAANPAGGGNGSGGNTKINSLTVDPEIDLLPKSNNSIYVVGGAGWYHKSTNFTVAQCCDFYGYPVVVNAASFASSQMGANLGMGFYHRLGGVYGDGTMKLFGEVRYLWINTPKIGETNGLGRTELIPITVGVRF